MAFRFRQQLDARRRLLEIAGGFASRRNLDPAADTGLAFLNHREIQHSSGLELAGEISADHELVVLAVTQLSSPGDFLHAFGDLVAVIGDRLVVFRGDDVELPPGLGVGVTSMTPAGISTRSLTVGEPLQPCGTLKTVR